MIEIVERVNAELVEMEVIVRFVCGNDPLWQRASGLRFRDLAIQLNAKVCGGMRKVKSSG